MAKTFNNWNALKKAMQEEMRKAMVEAEAKSYLDALHNASDYYSEGGDELVMYERTGQYGNSPRTTDVQGSGDNLNYEIYLDQNYEYPTLPGSQRDWSTPTIFAAIEEGFGGKYAPKGKHGRWQQTEEDIEKNVKEAFEKRFS